MGILTNPNDARADKHDVAEVIRRNSGWVSVEVLACQLQISEARAKELLAESIQGRTARVYKQTSNEVYKNRW